MTDAPDQTPNDLRAKTLAAFSELTGLPTVTRFTQRGRSRADAIFTMELADGRTVNLGNIDRVTSQAELNKTMLVTIGQRTTSAKQAEWNNILGTIFRHAIDHEHADGTGSAFADDVATWLQTYLAKRPTNADRNEAMNNNNPFIEDDRLHIHASSFLSYLRRDLGEKIDGLPRLRAALEDLGFTRRTLNYTITATKKRSTLSYYVRDQAYSAPPDDPDQVAPDEPPAPRARSPERLDQAGLSALIQEKSA